MKSVLVLAALLCVACAASAESFREHIAVARISASNVAVQFQFNTTLSNEGVEEKHFELFPRSLYNVLEHYDVASLRLSLTQELDHTNTARSSPSSLSDDDGYRYGSLPQEVVCTENLTPFVRLLPCTDQAGFGALLNPLVLFGEEYVSMLTEVDVVQNKYLLQQSVTLISNLERHKTQLPASLSWLMSSRKKYEWTFSAVEVSSCPLSHSTTISVYDGDVITESTLTGTNTNHDVRLPEKECAGDGSDSAEEFASALVVNKVHAIGSHGMAGRIVLEVYAEGVAGDSSDTYDVIITDMDPWFMPLYYHSLEISKNGERIAVEDLDYHLFEPARDHGAPSRVKFRLRMSRSDRVEMAVDFDKMLQHWTEYPPDAHKGYEIPPATATVLGDDGAAYTVYSGTLFIALPTPDFSMPYNVITMTSTVIAMCFGPMLRVLVQKSTDPPASKDRLIVRIARWCLGLFSRGEKKSS